MTWVTINGMLTLVLPMPAIWFEVVARTGTIKAGVDGVGELVSMPYDASWSDREAVYQVLNAILDEARLPTADGGWMGVSLYNPLSGQVASGPVPRTVVYTHDDVLHLPDTGLIGSIEQGLLTVGDSVLGILDPGVRSTQRAMASHLV